MSKNSIKLIQVFPNSEGCKKEIQDKKISWIINILREKYTDEVIEKAIKDISENYS